MHEEMHTLLNAFLDGELQGRQLAQLESHLEVCRICQEELKELRLVSKYLLASPAPGFTPGERFTDQLILSLPRRSPQPHPPQPGWLAWWLIPAGLLGAWFFVQTVFTLTSMLSAASMTGFLGQSSTVLAGGQATTWFGAVISLVFGGAGAMQPVLSLLNDASILTSDLVGGFAWQAGIVLAYWVWLFFWWRRSNPALGEVLKAS